MGSSTGGRQRCWASLGTEPDRRDPYRIESLSFVDAREVASSARGAADRVLAYAFFVCSLQRQPSTPANDKPSFLGHLWHKAGRLHGIGDNRGTSLCFSSVVFRVYR